MQPYIVPLTSNQRDVTDPSVSTSHFRIRLKSPVINASSVQLHKSMIANTSYVVGNNNRTFSVTYSGTTYVINLTPGNYTAASLATHLQTVLNVALATPAVTFTVVQNTTTNKYTITASASCTLNFTLYPLAARLLGFTAANITGTTFISPNCYQVTTTPFYYIRIHEIPARNDSGYFATVMNSVDVGSYNYSGMLDQTQVYQLSPGSIQQLTVSIYDSDGNIAQLNNGQVLIELIFHFC